MNELTKEDIIYLVTTIKLVVDNANKHIPITIRRRNAKKLIELLGKLERMYHDGRD